MNDTTNILLTILTLILPDEIRDVVVQGASAQGLDVEKLLEAYRTVYAVGFYDCAVHALSQGGWA